ncbi:unnamed protein product [Microthlaspi erraticum]|uniref:PUM-HD domain-containing protein n=1 Tax=Microthlaspi erraticum TaxID=1685480 RepID=A0A6D2IWH9_9BRAS|nr:unnamed protein product [Microthlaspi erraticum]
MAANGGARVSVPQENPAVPPPPSPAREILIGGFRVPIKHENPAVPPQRQIPIAGHPPQSTARRETNLAQEIQSLTNSFRSADALTRQETDACLLSLFNLMTSSEEDEEAAAFRDMISRLDGNDLGKMASLLTSYSDSGFLKIARNENGCKRLQELLGKSGDADTHFFAYIVRRFFHVMTDEHAFHVALRGMRVFSQEKKTAMWRHIHHHAIELACSRHSYIALREIITGAGDSYHVNHLLDIITSNALRLSYDFCGNHVVQHVLKLNDLRLTFNTAVSLQGYFVDLSFKKNGSYIVEKLLETDGSSYMVLAELLGCGEDMLLRLARSGYGNFVVSKALRVTRRVRADLFWGLVSQLVPLLPCLRGFKESKKIAEIVESIWID